MGFFDRRRERETAAANRQVRVQARAMVASAQRYKLDTKKNAEKLRRKVTDQQRLAWGYYDSIGEVKFAYRSKSWQLSRLRLFAAVQVDPDSDPVDVFDHLANPGETADGQKREALISDTLALAATEEMARLRSHTGGQPKLIRKLSLCLDVAGEAWLVGREKPAPEEEGEDAPPIEEWDVHAGGRLVLLAETYPGTDVPVAAIREDGKQEKDWERLPQDVFLLRIFAEHPERSNDADSNLFGVLDACEEFQILAQSIKASGLSRLNAGVTFVAEELTIVNGDEDADETTDTSDNPGGRDQFDEMFEEAIIEPISDPSHPQSQMPLLVRGPYDMKDGIVHTTFERPMDDKVFDRCEFLLKRIATAIDYPTDLILGLADVNHWTAWQVDENGFKQHLEPVATMIADGLSVGYLRMALLARRTESGEREFQREEVERIVVGIDASRIVSRPNHSEDADSGAKDLRISNEAWRKIKGFSDDDAPSDEELMLRMAIDKGSWTAPMTAFLLERAELAPAGFAEWVASKMGGQGGGSSTAPTTEGEGEGPDVTPGAPNDGEPPTGPDARALIAAASPDDDLDALAGRLMVADRSLRDRLLGAADAYMARAIERAGARVRSLARKDATVAAAIRTVDNFAVCANLGPSRVAGLVAAAGDGDPIDDLVEGAFDGLHERWDWWVGRSQAALRDEAAALGMSREELDDVETRQDEDRNEGWLVMLALLMAALRARLFSPRQVERPELGEGEFDDTILVQPGIIRQGLAVAGGARGVAATDVGGVVGQAGTRGVGGVQTGETAREIFARVGALWTGYRWHYGDASTRRTPFPPHRALAGVEFQTWEDRVLAVDAAYLWIGSGYFFPGDHAYCQCDFEPLFVRLDT